MELNDILLKIDEFFATASQEILNAIDTKLESITEDVTIEEFFAAYTDNFASIQINDSVIQTSIPSSDDYGIFSDPQSYDNFVVDIASTGYSLSENGQDIDYSLAA